MQQPQPDFALLRATLFYVESYPERLHHPKEEAWLFDRLRRRTSDCNALIDELQAQHAEGMVEGEIKEISEAEMVEAIKFAHEAIKVQILAQQRLREAVGSPEYRTYEGEIEDVQVYKKVK